MSIVTKAREKMMFQPASAIKTRAAAQADFMLKNAWKDVFIPFMKNEYKMPLRVKELDNHLTEDGKRVVYKILLEQRDPSLEEQQFLMADHERYRREHFEEVYVREHRLSTATQHCQTLVFFASEIMDDMLTEMLFALDKCKPISRFHKSISVRKRLREFSSKTYRHARDKEFAKLVDKESANDSSDRFKELYIDPLWDKVKAAIEKSCKEFVSKDEDTQKLLSKMGMEMDCMVRVWQTCEYANLFLGIMENVRKCLIRNGMPDDFQLPHNDNAMTTAVPMLQQLKRLLFGDIQVRCDWESDILQNERQIIKSLFDDAKVAEASMPGIHDTIKKQRELYTELKAKHPDMSEDNLYKEFYRLYPDFSIERQLAQKVADSYKESIAKVGNSKPITKKEYKVIWQNLCVTADSMLKPYITEEVILFKKCLEQMMHDHPEYDKAKASEELDKTLQVGLRLHPTASYEVLHSFLRFALPGDIQDAIKEAEEKRKLANAKRRAKREAMKKNKTD